MRIVEVMESLRAENYRVLYQKAQNRKVCIIIYGQPTGVFRDQAAKLEYSISAICQMCQDDLFVRED